MKKPIQCRCGLTISPSQQRRHETSRWHAVADEARRLRQLGLTFADIARHLGVTRAYISQKFAAIAEIDRELREATA